MKHLLALLLTGLAKANLRRYRPTIVAVTGSAGKTTTKRAIAAVLATKYRVSAPVGTLNDELGVPAAILGDFSGWFSDWYEQQGLTPRFWVRIFLHGIRTLVYTRTYPQILVLEYGADRPGDIKRLVSRFRPHVSVVTQVGEVPAHAEFYASAEHLAQEKMQIVTHLGSEDHAVLNYDDLTVLEMREHTRAHVHTFGTAVGADVEVTDIVARLDGAVPLGISFDLTGQSHAMPAVMNGTVGRGVALSCAAAVTVGSIFGVGMADAVQALAQMHPPAGRLRVLRGIRGTVIIDDTYNASPAAMHLAIDTVKHLPAQRRVLVLGDMLELGEHSVQAHQSVGDMAGDVAQILVCVGERARFIADSAGNQMPKENIHWFHDSDQAKATVQQLLRPGDLVLVKGSQGKRMERIVREIMAEPERAGQLLVRQSARWLAK